MKRGFIRFFILALLGMSTAAHAETRTLSVKQTITLALQKNFSVLTSREMEKDAAGKALESLAALLPRLSASVSQTNSTENLRALGLNLAGFPNLVGPFNSFDARLRLAQTLFNFSDSQKHAADAAGIQIAELREKLAREQIAAAAGLAYINVLQKDSLARAAGADLTLAGQLAKLAHDQHEAGIATGIDVARADTALAQASVKLSQMETAVQQARLQFNRIAGLPLSEAVTLTDALAPVETSPSPEDAVRDGLRRRYEIKIASREVAKNGYLLRSAANQRIPSLDLTADYGLSGSTINSYDLPTRNFGLRLDIPIFDGGLTHGEIVRAESQKQEAELNLLDTQTQVEEDIRLAVETLLTTGKETAAAGRALNLAERELVLARDRFQEGLGDNIEVVNAQTALADARSESISALADFNVAWLNFLTSVGRAQDFDFQNGKI